jgi:pyruvate/2-oxoglutarate dehydrogenase complex dihydrolipoamide dehydrogenase (E3) component
MAAGPAADYDLIVIGAGAAGSTAAFEARGQGARVAMVEQWKVGGTCLNAGCDPTKSLVRAARVMHEARTANRYGIAIEQARADWPAVIGRVARVIDTIRGGDGDRNIREAGIDLRKGHARLRSPREVEVDGDILRGEAVLLAVGARAAAPPIPGLRETGFITNIEAVALPRLPASLAIVGAGTVAMEFAQIFARFGVAVTVLGRNPRLLPDQEPELAEVLREVLESEGIRIATGVRLDRVSRETGGKRLDGRQGDAPFAVVAEEILVAAGRTPNVEALGLDAAGIAYDATGILVDAELATTAPGVWAAGDCVAGAPRFTSLADHQARVAVHNALGGTPARRAAEAVVPWAIFTDPELGRVGLTEAQARAAGHQVRAETVPMRDLARAVIAGETAGAVKLVAETGSGRLLGGSVLAAGGGELLSEIALAVRLGLPANAIAETLHAYPTFSEGVFWTAWELAKPRDAGLDAARGVETPRGVVATDEDDGVNRSKYP